MQGPRGVSIKKEPSAKLLQFEILYHVETNIDLDGQRLNKPKLNPLKPEKMEDLRTQIELNSADVGRLLEYNQEFLEKDDDVCDAINNCRESMEFFLSIGEENRALYEILSTKRIILNYLGIN